MFRYLCLDYGLRFFSVATVIVATGCAGSAPQPPSAETVFITGQLDRSQQELADLRGTVGLLQDENARLRRELAVTNAVAGQSASHADAEISSFETQLAMLTARNQELENASKGLQQKLQKELEAAQKLYAAREQIILQFVALMGRE